MILNRLLAEKGLTRYKLSQLSGVPNSTIRDICSGKTKIQNCSAHTVYKIATTLNISMDSLLQYELNGESFDKREPFEIFKGNVCHQIKELGDLEFIYQTLKTDKIFTLYKKEWFAETMYLLAAVDYLSRINNIPLCSKYNHLRGLRLKDPLYPESIIIVYNIIKDPKIKQEAIDAAIPEFKRHNIIEGNIKDVC